MNIVKISCVTLVCWLFCSCNDPVDFNPHEVRLDEHEYKLNIKNIQRAQDNSLKDDTIRFVITGDTQGALKETEEFVEKINSMPNLDFLMVCGDFTNYGLKEEFIWLNDILKQLYIPYIGVIGNHDFIGNGQLIFEEMFSDLDFSFKIGEFKFIGINTNSIEYGYDGTVPNIDWLQEELKDTVGIKNIFVFSHVMPWDDAFDSSLEQDFAESLANSKVKVSFHGHHHDAYVNEPYNDGVKYSIVGSTGKRSFLVVSLWGDGEYKIERIFF